MKSQPRVLMRKDSPNKSGKCPLFLRLYFPQKKDITLQGLHTSPKHWDHVRNRLKLSHPDYEDRLLEINLALAKATNILKEYRLREIPITAEAFVREFKGSRTKGDFLSYIQEGISSEYERGIISKETRDIHLVSLRKLESFAGTGGIPFHEINRAWLERFDLWHVKTFKNSPHEGKGAREKALKTVRKFLLDAQAEGVRFQYPFKGFSWPKQFKRPVFLSREEIKKLQWYLARPDEVLEAMKREATRRELSPLETQRYLYGVERVRRVIRCFLAQCFMGVRYIDLQKLRHDHLQGDHLVFIPHKTRDTSGAQVRMKFTPILQALTTSKKGPLFGPPSNQKYNQYLKEVAQLVGINKHLTSHVARHTFATMFLERGGSLEVLKELLGVKKMETLMVYVHITDNRKDKELELALADFMA